jgi:hypothetical protein
MPFTFDETCQILQGWLGQHVSVSVRTAGPVDCFTAGGALHSIERKPIPGQQPSNADPFIFTIGMPRFDQGQRTWFSLLPAQYAGAVEEPGIIPSRPGLIVATAGIHLVVSRGITPTEMAAMGAASGT